MRGERGGGSAWAARRPSPATAATKARRRAASHRARTPGCYTSADPPPVRGYNRRLSSSRDRRAAAVCEESVRMASTSGPIRVLHFGLGPIGVGIVRQVAARKGFKIVGAVDIDPAKVGRDLSEVAGLSKRLKVPVMADAKKAIKATRPEVAVLGTGVNPGFVMDALPIMLTGVCERVEAIRVDRIQDARIRRLPFQQKIGAGLTREQFQAKVDDASVRHVGLAESISMIADAIGWKLDRITDEIQPKMATVTVASEFLAVDPGYVCGIVQDGIGYQDGKPIITLHMEAYLGAPESYDAVDITGSPMIKSKIAGGVHGDVATASIAVNSIPKILEVAPGLHTMRDMPIPSYYGG